VGTRIARDDLIEGDLVFFNTRRSYGHVGIYIGNNKFVHASSRNREIRIDDLDEPYYNEHFVKAVRLKGLDEEVL
jgi:cell wall-associated NlpC family hydrolase